MARATRDYDSDPLLYGVPLTPDDLDWLPDPAAGKAPGKSAPGRDPFSHLASRALATARELRTLRARFDHEVRRRVDMHARSSAVAGSVSPRDAVRFLSPQELEEVFDTYARQRLAALEAQRQLAEQQCAQAQADTLTAAAALLRAADEIADRIPGLAGRLREASASLQQGRPGPANLIPARAGGPADGRQP